MFGQINVRAVTIAEIMGIDTGSAMMERCILSISSSVATELTTADTRRILKNGSLPTIR